MAASIYAGDVNNREYREAVKEVLVQQGKNADEVIVSDAQPHEDREPYDPFDPKNWGL